MSIDNFTDAQADQLLEMLLSRKSASEEAETETKKMAGKPAKRPDEEEAKPRKHKEDEDEAAKKKKKASKARHEDEDEDEDEEKEDEDEDEEKEDEDEDEAAKKKKKAKARRDDEKYKNKKSFEFETKSVAVNGLSSRYSNNDLSTERVIVERSNKGLNFAGKYEQKQATMFTEAFKSPDCNASYWKSESRISTLSDDHYDILEKCIDLYANKSNVSKGAIYEAYQEIKHLRSIEGTTNWRAKNAYNSQVGTEGGVFGLPYQIMFAEKFFSYSPLLSMYNFIPTVSNVVKIINTATLPQVTAVPEGQLVNDSVIGEYESIDINIRVNYQATLRLTELMLRSENVSVMTKIQEDSSLQLAREISFLALLGDGAADGIQGLLFPVNYDITNFTLENGMYAKPAGMKKVIANGSPTTIMLDSLKALCSLTVPPQYYEAGEIAFAMNQKTWQQISVSKSSSGFYLLDAISYPMHGGLAPAEIRDVAFAEMRTEDLPAGGIRGSLQSNGKRMVPHLWGYPVILDPSMPDIASGSTPVVFGNFRKAYTLAQTIAMGIRPVAIGAASASGLVTTGNQFQQGFQVYTQMGGKATNSQCYACLLMV